MEFLTLFGTISIFVKLFVFICVCVCVSVFICVCSAVPNGQLMHITPVQRGVGSDATFYTIGQQGVRRQI